MLKKKTKTTFWDYSLSILRHQISSGSFSISSAGALVCLDAAAEPAGEGQGPHWSPPFHEKIFPHGAGMWRCFHYWNFNMIISCPTTFLLCIVVRGASWLPMPKSQQSWVRSHHPSTKWNLRGSRWSSVEISTKKYSVLYVQGLAFS